MKTLFRVRQSAQGPACRRRSARPRLRRESTGLVSNLLEPVGHAQATPQASVYAEVMGTHPPAEGLRDDVNMFAHIGIRLTLTASTTSGPQPVDLCEKRCPLYGSLAAALLIDVTHYAKAA